MVHWVYVLKSSTTNSVYVGETIRLYRRWNEHRTGRGGITTSQDDYDTLIGLYNVSHNINFLDYYKCSQSQTHDWKCEQLWDEDVDKSLALEMENHITERYRIEYKTKNWWDVRGGKYCTNHGILDLTNVVVDRPLCKCGYPCEVNMKKDRTKIYFTCPIPDWVTFEGISMPFRCNFWEEFKPYSQLRTKHRAEYALRMREKQRQAFVRQCNELTAEDFTT